jgi:hypothetical protein
MTVKRDLKKRVRERQAGTGERYTTALQRVLAQRPHREHAPVPVIELVDVSEVAAAVGCKGRVLMYPELAERVDPGLALPRIRQLLRATVGDPRTSLFRALLITGEPPMPLPTTAADVAEMMALTGMLFADRIGPELGHRSTSLRFLERAQAGLGGPSDSGLLLSVAVDGRQGLEHVICMVWGLLPPGTPVQRDPFVVLRSARSLLDDAVAALVDPGEPGEQP